jgi:hypothetical protein
MAIEMPLAVFASVAAETLKFWDVIDAVPVSHFLLPPSRMIVHHHPSAVLHQMPLPPTLVAPGFASPVPTVLSNECVTTLKCPFSPQFLQTFSGQSLLRCGPRQYMHLSTSSLLHVRAICPLPPHL